MNRRILAIVLLFIVVICFSSCKRNVVGNSSQADTSSNACVNINGSSTNSDEEPANIDSSALVNTDEIESEIVNDWVQNTISIETTSSNTDDSNESNSTDSNKSEETNSEETENVNSENEDNTSSVISIPEFYEGRY